MNIAGSYLRKLKILSHRLLKATDNPSNFSSPKREIVHGEGRDVVYP
jgi:hypothetical protein